jgi:hypothetical protein
MGRWIGVATAALLLSWAGCGDGTFIISVNSGLIVGPPRCDATGGEFDLREPGGLTVLVVITSSTRIIVAGGGSGGCADLTADAAVEVSGRTRDDRIIATRIAVQ